MRPCDRATRRTGGHHRRHDSNRPGGDDRGDGKLRLSFRAPGVWMFLVLLLAWVLKISSATLHQEGARPEAARPLLEWVRSWTRSVRP